MAATQVNIPISAIPFAFMRGKLNQLRVFIKMKATEGRFIEDAGKYDKKDLNRLCRIKWLKLYEGKYYQVKWGQALPLNSMYSHAKIPVECLDDPKKFKAVLFYLGYCYLMSPQAQRGRRTRRKRKNRRQVNESAHFGGISHSICMSFFGFKKTWCSNMRRLCEKYGLGKWKRRWLKVSTQPMQDSQGTYNFHVADQMAEGPGKYKLTRGNILVEEIASKFRQKLDPRLHIPFKYRRITHEAYS